MQAGRLEDAGRAFEESLEAARSRQADFEVALSLYAKATLARSMGTQDDDDEREAAPSSTGWASSESPESRAWQPSSWTRGGARPNRG